MAALIRAATVDDAARIADIYDHYVRTSTVTFEESAVGREEIVRRMAAVDAAGLPWLVAQPAPDLPLAGYAYATPWRARSAYRFSVESSVYVAPEAMGRGVGEALCRALFARLQTLGRHTVIAGITLPNPASIALHERLGLVKVAHFRRVGYKFGRWLDVGYWQLHLSDPADAGSVIPSDVEPR